MNVPPANQFLPPAAPAAPVVSAESPAEPVMTVEWFKTAIVSILLAVVSVLGALGVWHPTDEQVVAITGAAAVVVAVMFPLVAFFVRKRVTPVAKP